MDAVVTGEGGVARPGGEPVVRPALGALAGAALGYGLLHPAVMLVGHAMLGDACACPGGTGSSLTTLARSFAPAMLPWSLTLAGVGAAVGWLVARLVAVTRDRERLLVQLATTDPLTGVANRRSFDRALAAEWDRSRRHGYNLGLLLVDVDHFKRFNDRYGHPAGDDCLRRVAGALAGQLHRPGDLLARYGGEEFAALLPDTTPEGVVRVAAAMRAAVAALGVPHEGSDVAAVVTVSVGVASGGDGASSTPESLLAAADRALYRAKAGGRDGYCVAEAEGGCGGG